MVAAQPLRDVKRVGLAATFYVAFFGVVFARGLGAPIVQGDAQSEYFPQFTYPNHTWTSLLFSGYPLVADPQNASFSPTRLVFSALGWWNGYAISALVIAATTTFVFAFEVSESVVGALLAGLVYGANGFFLRSFHLTPMLQSSAWLPLLFWAVERLPKTPRLWVAAVGAVAIALAIFGGYLQPCAYGLVLAGIYALVGIRRAQARATYMGMAALLFAGGLALASVQLAPTFELFLRSQRTTMPYGQYVGWSWIFPQWTELLVPRAFLGVWQTAETQCLVAPDADHAFVSIVAIGLALAGSVGTRREGRTWFWLAVMAFSLAFAFTDRTPLARLLYHVPPYNKFRVAPRHMIFFGLGAAYLAARAVGAIERRVLSWRVVAGSGVAVGALLLYALAFGCTTATSTASLVSVAVFVASGAVVAWWMRQPKAAPAVIAVAAIDLATFDGVGYARPTVGAIPFADPSYYARTPDLARLSEDLTRTKTRSLTTRGRVATAAEAPVNANLLWNIPSVTGYSPIAPVTSLDQVGVAYFGVALRDWWLPADRSLDVAAVRFVTLPDSHVRVSPVELGLEVDARADLTIPLPEGTFQRVRLAVDLWGAENAADGAEVATLDGSPILAGRDVSEWIVGCVPTQHGRAEVLETQTVPMPSGPCHAYTFLMTRTGRFSDHLTLHWSGGERGRLRIHRVTVDDQPVLPVEIALAHDPRWRLERREGVVVAENLRALPRARLVGAVARVPDALDAIRAGRYEPRTTALADVDAALDPRCAEGAVTWRRDDDTDVELDVTSPARCYLVLADTAYPGWTATIDGAAEPIHPTDGSYRGVFVPEGNHRVAFRFRSRTLWLGAVMTLATVLAAALSRKRA